MRGRKYWPREGGQLKGYSFTYLVTLQKLIKEMASKKTSIKKGWAKATWKGSKDAAKAMRAN